MFRFVLIGIVCALAQGGLVSENSNKLDGRVIGGKDTQIEEVPYQVAVLKHGRIDCGGSILSFRWVLTAAHCVKHSNPKWVTLRAGSSIDSSGGSIHQAKKIVIHPLHSFVVIMYDFALIKVIEPFDYGPKVSPISLARKEPKGGEIGLISGWGTVIEGGNETSIKLQSVKVPIVDRKSCQKIYTPVLINKSFICAGFEEGGKGPCIGDSGGPLVVNNKLVGVVSWGVGCALPKKPAVFSNVAAVRKWIRMVTIFS